ncbi:type IVB secretion system protein IcmH/DotU [Pseudomonas citronellolis]|jgi:type VI secretion system protein ImpK|uniref:type IVB secretion system protein IcmH/DotU n=1 Tax=Pseudomonas citronellolis TaxID=53408 RepID=UPI002270F915|nr:type IVB secretion system protein IcmH/DotU [Pseudomonas citronellolis]WAB90558.1 type IVB secretion system protein IcmH/DotU [Pseudomonas citronellolis]
MSTTVNINRESDFHREQPTPAVGRKDDITFNTVAQLDHDADLAFQLRGHSINPLVDAAMPLFGLVIRLRKLESYSQVNELHTIVRDQIKAVDEEVLRHGYDRAVHMAYRYALCSFVDDAVMATPWGSNSPWAERSLLSIFHNETWGGEKFFTVLSRMQMEPEHYRDVLEFKYLCLCLGFKGKYGVQHNQAESLNNLIVKLHRVLRPLRGESPEKLTDAHSNIVSRRYRISHQWPIWMPWAIALAVLAGIYALFAVNLGSTTELVLRSLDNILKP